MVSITNNYGPITVKPSGSRQVVIETVSHSDAVSLVNEQHGDRIELRSMSSRPGTNLVDYTVLVPADAFVSLRSSDGTLRAQGLRGDVILEAAAASVEVTDISDAHLHIRTLSGPISLTDIRNSHLDIHSVSGNVNLRNVTRTVGRGELRQRSDLLRRRSRRRRANTCSPVIPATSMSRFPPTPWSTSRRAPSRVSPIRTFPSPTAFPRPVPGILLFKPGKILGSRFELRSFSGKIPLKRP